MGRRLTISLSLVAAACAAPRGQAPAAGVGRGEGATVVVGHYRLQSNAWVNLHQRLLNEAQGFATTAPSIDSADLGAWKAQVDAYRAFVRRRSPITDGELVRLNDALSDARGDALPAALPAPAAAALRAAMPLYRRAQWAADDRANRFFIAVAEPLLRSAAEELAAAHARAYGVPFPTHVLVDVSPEAGQFGAYTVGEGDVAHVVISSTAPGQQGFRALELLLHEPSHAIVDATSGAIGAELTRYARELGVKPRYNLWHAILFYTSGELTRRALAARGVTDYVPIVREMYARGFDGFQQPLETHWQAWLDGRTTREAALRQILVETASPSGK